MFERVLKITVGVVERCITALLVLLIALGFVGICIHVAGLLARHAFLDLEALLQVIDHVLAVFILIELFSIALAYLHGKRVLRTVLEATFVAVSRKVIAFEPGDNALAKGVVLALLMIAVIVAWFVLSRIALDRPEETGGA